MPSRRLAGLVALACTLGGATVRAQPPATSAGDLLLVLETDAATARFLDPTTGASVATWPSGPFPHEDTVSPDGREPWVADRQRDTIAVRDARFAVDSARVRPSPLTASLGRGAVPLGELVARDGRATPDGMPWVPRAVMAR